MLKKLVIFASGNGSNFQAIVEACERKEISAEVVLLVVDKNDAYVIQRATNYGIPFLLVDYKNQDQDMVEFLMKKTIKNYQADLIVLAGFLRILSKDFVDSFKDRIINIHPSLLPKYKGLKAVNQALANNEEEIGVTVHYVTEDLDAGQIIKQEGFSIKGLTEEDVYEKVHKIEHELYIEGIKEVLEKI